MRVYLLIAAGMEISSSRHGEKSAPEMRILAWRISRRYYVTRPLEGRGAGKICYAMKWPAAVVRRAAVDINAGAEKKSFGAIVLWYMVKWRWPLRRMAALMLGWQLICGQHARMPMLCARVA